MNLGEVLNSVGSIGNKNMILKPESTKIKGDSFYDVLKTAVDDVNAKQVKGYDAMESIATGEVESLQEAVQHIKKAELSLKLGLEVENKALSAFKKVMEMPV